MTNCEQKKCLFWDGEVCTDSVEYINTLNGELCCRFHTNAILKEEITERGE